MKRFVFTTLVAVAVLAVAAPLVAQNPTGVLTGRVTYEGQAQAGVTVTASSPSMQGTRVEVTESAGDYNFRGLPAGDYKLSFALAGFKTIDFEVKISAAQSRRIDAQMYDESYAEEIMVTSAFETVSDSTQAQTTYTLALIEQLPIQRTIESTVLMVPGVAATGTSSGYISISGAMSFENLFLINGVVVNENLRGQPLDLYIEGSPRGRGMSLGFPDANDDGWPDIFVGNDTNPQLLFINNQDGTFTDRAEEYGVLRSADGIRSNLMGLDYADINGIAI